MSKIGKSYKKSVELRSGSNLDLNEQSLVTITNPVSTEEFNAPSYILTGWISVEANTDISVSYPTGVVFATSTLTVTLPDSSKSFAPITVRNISGVTTITAVSGSIEMPTLTVGQATTLAPRASGWFEI